ncbi:Signal peptidase I [hydrothermal vent metagenome]|uniref:signal peptidase I n=1 Tax=hydrothermal vent metagenome TaxID=652676 RepID=A0A3B0W6D7_9ZZZZ
MILDFSFYLFIAVAFTGFVWVIDKLFFEAKRNQVVDNSTQNHQGIKISDSGKEPVIVEYSKSFFPVLLIVFLLRGFIVEPFRIPSGSMLPSLYIGDFILVNKFAYGIRVPVLNKKIINLNEPKRGDVVVFRYPRDPNLDYIKRVIGLPGDIIAYYNKVLYVNGKPVEREFVGQYKGPGQTFANEYNEKLSDNTEHAMLLLPARPNSLQGEYIVPEGMYFCMGDNRDNSNDSRVWGPVPEENLLGKAFMIWMHYSDEWHFERIGNMIK